MTNIILACALAAYFIATRFILPVCRALWGG